MNQSRAPLIVAIVLLIPALYLGSYFALVVPSGMPFATGFEVVTNEDDQNFDRFAFPLHYRCCGDRAATLFWPIEQIDRNLRPDAWVNMRRIRHVRHLTPAKPIAEHE